MLVSRKTFNTERKRGRQNVAPFSFSAQPDNLCSVKDQKTIR